jgi:hypothetical protein
MSNLPALLLRRKELLRLRFQLKREIADIAAAIQQKRRAQRAKKSRTNN